MQEAHLEATQIQQVPQIAHPLLATMHGWGFVVLSLMIMYGMYFSLTRYTRRDCKSDSPLKEDRHPAN